MTPRLARRARITLVGATLAVAALAITIAGCWLSTPWALLWAALIGAVAERVISDNLRVIAKAEAKWVERDWARRWNEGTKP
jgi:uncharacterized protein (DUF697 family)